MVLEHVPSGIGVDMDFIRSEMARRAPGKSPMSTARREADEPHILSGVFEGKTTGTPLCAVIENTDTRSKDYAKLKDLPRPGHADYSGRVRYEGYNDYRGGGHFSGRLTAPLVFAGALAKLILRERGVTVSAYISNVGGIQDPTPEQVEEAVLAAKGDLDSVGGAIRCTVEGPARRAGRSGLRPQRGGYLLPAAVRRPGGEGGGLRRGLRLRRHAGQPGQRPLLHGRKYRPHPHQPHRRRQRRHHQRHAGGL